MVKCIDLKCKQLDGFLPTSDTENLQHLIMIFHVTFWSKPLFKRELLSDLLQHR